MAVGTVDKHPLILFGGERGWNSADWTDSDDRVRGGKSQSYLECSEKSGRFYGNLDIETLGGAGFASQRTTGELKFDLSQYAGVSLNISKGDKKRYTIILKDEILPKNEANGRDQASISYECDFELPPQTEPGDTHNNSVFIPWASLNPTYRGKVKKDAKPLDLTSVKRISIMMRSFFGTQEGDFSITLRSISALAKAPEPASVAEGTLDDRHLEAGVKPQSDESRYFVHRIDSRLIKTEVRLHRVTAYVLLGTTLFFLMKTLSSKLLCSK